MVATRKRDYTELALHQYPQRKCKMNPTTPPADGTCYLLRLAGELRNRIYEYALTEDEGLHYHNEQGQGQLCVTVQTIDTSKRKGVKRARVAERRVANQLQFVNKQIRRETKGLGLKLNDLHFRTNQPRDPSPLATCSAFLSKLAPYWFQHLHTITIRRKDDIVYPLIRSQDEVPFNAKKYNDFPAQDELITICRANPNMTIEWACPMWKLAKSFCVFKHRGIALSLAYRDTDVISLFPGHSGNAILARANYEQDVDWWRKGRPNVNVPNFKVFPWNVSQTRDAFVQRLEDASTYCGGHFPDDITVDMWMKKALEWYDHGI